jgi:hypothetical protein
MDEKTKGFVIRAVTIGAVIAALFGVFVYINALWEGKTVFPEQLSSAIIGLLVFAISSASVWLHSRNSAKTQQTVRDAREEIKHEIKHTLENSGGDAVAEKVKTALAPAVRTGNRRHRFPLDDTGERRRYDDTEGYR